MDAKIVRGIDVCQEFFKDRFDVAIGTPVRIGSVNGYLSNEDLKSLRDNGISIGAQYGEGEARWTDLYVMMEQ